MPRKLRIKIITNPLSGRQTNLQLVNDILAHLSDAQALLRADIFYVGEGHHGSDIAQDTPPDTYDLILSVGGDGTAHGVVNGMMNGNIHTPLAIYGGGTVNDYATAMGLPSDPLSFSQMLIDGNTTDVDIGRAGDRFFLNVLAGGLMTDIAYKVPSDSKAALGKLAYWIEGALELPAGLHEGVPIHVTCNNVCFDSEALLFIVSNSTNVGGFKNLFPLAKPNDGLLDVFIISRLTHGDVLPLIGKALAGDLLRNENVLYYQTSSLQISTEKGRSVRLDLDGEEGPELPVSISCIPGAVSLIVPFTEK
ncbi:MAG: diacylglycerol kinase family lipid kinase [Oscillospiraceae bacterium]|nr:diacylglycerol kinase family lipid kinase [Oscillospiraceae bacterium]